MFFVIYWIYIINSRNQLRMTSQNWFLETNVLSPLAFVLPPPRPPRYARAVCERTRSRCPQTQKRDPLGLRSYVCVHLLLIIYTFVSYMVNMISIIIHNTSSYMWCSHTASCDDFDHSNAFDHVSARGLRLEAQRNCRHAQKSEINGRQPWVFGSKNVEESSMVAAFGFFFGFKMFQTIMLTRWMLRQLMEHWMRTLLSHPVPASQTATEPSGDHADFALGDRQNCSVKDVQTCSNHIKPHEHPGSHPKTDRMLYLELFTYQYVRGVWHRLMNDSCFNIVSCYKLLRAWKSRPLLTGAAAKA